MESPLSGPRRLAVQPRLWLSALLLTVPWVAIVVVGWRFLRPGERSGLARVDRQGLILVVLSLSATPVLLRQTDGPHIAASAPVASVLLAWLLALLLRSARARLRAVTRWRPGVALTGPMRWLRVGGSASFGLLQLGFALLLVALTWTNIAQAAPIARGVQNTALLAGPGATVDHARRVISLLATQPPIEALRGNDVSGDGLLIRYVEACTRPTDRLLIASDAPIYHYYFYAGRGFAGGLPSFDPGQFSSPENQRLTLARLGRQSVPIVLVDSERSLLASEFPLVHDYVLANYGPAREPTLSAERGVSSGYQILVNRRAIPTGVYQPLGLPCFS